MLYKIMVLMLFLSAGAYANRKLYTAPFHTEDTYDFPPAPYAVANWRGGPSAVVCTSTARFTNLSSRSQTVTVTLTDFSLDYSIHVETPSSIASNWQGTGWLFPQNHPLTTNALTKNFTLGALSANLVSWAFGCRAAKDGNSACVLDSTGMSTASDFTGVPWVQIGGSAPANQYYANPDCSVQDALCGSSVWLDFRAVVTVNEDQGAISGAIEHHCYFNAAPLQRGAVTVEHLNGGRPF